MTTMGLNYLVYEETKRSNLAKEGENVRSNTAREKENFRSNVVGQVEVSKHNRMTENLGWGQLGEQQRSNQAREFETNRANTTVEGIRSRELEEKQYQFDTGNLSPQIKSLQSTERLGLPVRTSVLEAINTGLDSLRKWVPLSSK